MIANVGSIRRGELPALPGTNNYVRAGGEVFTFNDRDPVEVASAMVFCEDRSPRGKPRGTAWRPWRGMPVWIRTVGA